MIIKPGSLLLLLLSAAVITCSNPLMANQTTFQIDAKVEPSVNITNNSNLNFGSFTAAGGDVTINPETGVRSTTGPLLVGVDETRAQFTLDSGPVSTNYHVYINDDNSDIELIRDGVGAPDPVTDTMNVTSWQIYSEQASAGGAAGTVQGTTEGTGADVLYVGATLQVSATQTAGSYSINGTNGTVALNVQFD